jgi:cation diffusion facilitator family transporter
LNQRDGHTENQRIIRRITWIGLWINLILAGIKFVAGWLGSSQAVVADGVHSLSDTVTDIAILVGVKYWSAPPDECHPYGHHRIETLVTTCIGVLLAVAALGIGYDAINGLRERSTVQPGGIALIGALLSIAFKEVLFHWTRAAGKRSRSTALIANAWHHRTDALSSLPVALAVLVAMAKPEWSFVDPLGALLVTVFILHAAWRITQPALEELADRGASEKVRKRILEATRKIEHLNDAHRIRTRKMGGGIFLDLHITVDGKMTVFEGHEISREVKKRIQESLPEVMDVVVHIEPDDHGHVTKANGKDG